MVKAACNFLEYKFYTVKYILGNCKDIRLFISTVFPLVTTPLFSGSPQQRQFLIRPCNFSANSPLSNDTSKERQTRLMCCTKYLDSPPLSEIAAVRTFVNPIVTTRQFPSRLIVDRLFGTELTVVHVLNSHLWIT